MGACDTRSGRKRSNGGRFSVKAAEWGRSATNRRLNCRRPAHPQGLGSRRSSAARRIVIVIIGMQILHSVGSDATQDGPGEWAIK